MVLNKLKLLAASSLVVVGLAGVGAVHFASATSPATASSVTQTVASTGNDTEVNDTSAADTDNVNDQQGNQLGSDNGNATDKKD